MSRDAGSLRARRHGGRATRSERRDRAARRAAARTAAGPALTRFLGGGSTDGAELDYEQTLEALLGLIGRPVLVLFSGAAGSPFITGILSGRLDRGELDERLREVLLRDDAAQVETLFFHVGSRQTGFVIRPDEFERGFWRGEGHLVVHLGACAVNVMAGGELGRALER